MTILTLELFFIWIRKKNPNIIWFFIQFSFSDLISYKKKKRKIIITGGKNFQNWNIMNKINPPPFFCNFSRRPSKKNWLNKNEKEISIIYAWWHSIPTDFKKSVQWFHLKHHNCFFQPLTPRKKNPMAPYEGFSQTIKLKNKKRTRRKKNRTGKLFN